MTVFLLILKIIGITLLVIIALILLTLLSVLFSPVRYSLKVNKGKASDDFCAEFRAAWMLHILNALIRFDGELFYRVRILFLTIKSSIKKEKKIKKKVRKKEITHSNDENLIEAETKEKESENEIKEIVSDIDYKHTESENIDFEEEKLTFFQKINKFYSAASDFFNGFNDKIHRIFNKIKDVYDNVEYYYEFINDDRNKKAIILFVNEIKRALKSIRPRKIKGYFHFGFADPNTTGKVFSILGILYPLIEDRIEIDGTFDEEVLEGNIFLSGRITVFVLIRTAWKIYFDKNIRRTLKAFKREE